MGILVLIRPRTALTEGNATGIVGSSERSGVRRTASIFAALADGRVDAALALGQLAGGFVRRKTRACEARD